MSGGDWACMSAFTGVGWKIFPARLEERHDGGRDVTPCDPSLEVPGSPYAVASLFETKGEAVEAARLSNACEALHLQLRLLAAGTHRDSDEWLCKLLRVGADLRSARRERDAFFSAHEKQAAPEERRLSGKECAMFDEART